jgi:Kef-type K+ transport system membrane component KefB
VQTNPVVDLFLSLGIILITARLAGTLARRFGQPRVFGELLAGVILGPTLLNFLSWPVFHNTHLNESIHELAEIGVLLLMFSVGLDLHVNELIQVGRAGVFGGIAGALIPFALTIPVVLVFGFSMEVALFASAALAATSVSISAQTMLELGVLQTREGYALLAMALVDDVLAILLVSFVVALTSSGTVDVGAFLGIILRMGLYIGGATALAWFVLPRLFNYIAQFEDVGRGFGITLFVLAFALIYGWSAEFFGGVAAITGAFIAGIGVSRLDYNIKERIQEAIGAISYVFLMPVFFASVGLQTDLKQILLDEGGQVSLVAIPFALALLAMAVLSKVGGVTAGARLGGFNPSESFRVGVAMVSRGEVGLIIAAIGLSLGVFTSDVFPALFLVILVSTVITPPLVRYVFRENERETPD